jgi:two-component system, chemotaxis family, CheB/CheR fusion protein
MANRFQKTALDYTEQEPPSPSDGKRSHEKTPRGNLTPVPRYPESGEECSVTGRSGSKTHDIEDDLRDALSFAQAVVDTVREPLLVLDGTLRVTTASRAFYTTFGVSPEQTLQRFIYDLGNGQWNIPALRVLLEEVLPQHKAFQDFEVVHTFPAIGRRVMLLNARRLIGGNNTEHILLAIEDITERKRILDELVRSNEDLQRFAYVAAHDLRSPLNSGLNLLQLLARQRKDTAPEGDARLLDLAIASFMRLGELMEAILAYSAAENAPQRRTAVSLDEPLQIALQNLQHHIQKAGATIDARPLPTVSTDRTQMVMVFQNLIGNAIKYHGKEPPLIVIEAAEMPGEWQVTVRDNGVGFEQEYADQIFEPFRRLGGSGIPGSGIGLATCKRIIERLGGKIWAESAPGKGSAFYFTLPLGF